MLDERPLVIVTSSLWQYLEGELNGPRISQFARFLLDVDDVGLKGKATGRNPVCQGVRLISLSSLQT